MKKPVILQVVGYKNAGKTTLICHLIQTWSNRNFRIGTIKHDAHDFEMDVPHTDTWKHQVAGAHTVAITSSQKTAIIQHRSLSLSQLIASMAELDLVLVEGFKQENYQKVLIIKTEADLSLLHSLKQVIAIVSWFPFKHPTIPTWQIQQIDGLADFLLKQLSEVHDPCS
ncbi:molybdopterin-guanine dinucleotide biosynthesis protein B [Thermoflavimicrobium dichotomicum]|uniref:Molybdopterin-guanine dinucleotide biosynthesis protein B n=1 Tax=Thermoflavimicrobium dichotomicum TaxID=46223 RepID=A0A1I3SUU8_9BACL|nr:molybdopterin-guanine dinucleotide biosynthesis protein B [Thermoflavimicrobium dichotomicum]SFJ62618.1 molybdopterin-guanine dinucleotide biosynthesis protein B [Thermoflavimicrobium dichotomicum]